MDELKKTGFLNRHHAILEKRINKQIDLNEKAFVLLIDRDARSFGQYVVILVFAFITCTLIYIVYHFS